MLELHGITKTFNPGTVNEKRALNGVELLMNVVEHSLNFFLIHNRLFLSVTYTLQSDSHGRRQSCRAGRW